MINFTPPPPPPPKKKKKKKGTATYVLNTLMSVLSENMAVILNQVLEDVLLNFVFNQKSN